jgi:hypothetical protein
MVAVHGLAGGIANSFVAMKPIAKRQIAPIHFLANSDRNGHSVWGGKRSRGCLDLAASSSLEDKDKLARKVVR